MDEKVLAYKDYILRRSDMDILRGPCYLNDQIIGFYFRYLSCLFNSVDILLVPPSLSFWLTNSEDAEDVKACVGPLTFCNKELIIFPVNDNDDMFEGDNGSHWSLLVYARSMNEFVHHDSMEGVNNLHAMKLYQAVKQFVGPTAESSSSSKLSASTGRDKKKTNKKKGVQPVTKKSLASPTGEVPGFVECPTPQQTNGYDCGLYVMAIARTVCQWYVSNLKKANNWFSAVEKDVNAAVELKMRTEVMELIEDLRLEED